MSWTVCASSALRRPMPIGAPQPAGGAARAGRARRAVDLSRPAARRRCGSASSRASTGLPVSTIMPDARPCPTARSGRGRRRRSRSSSPCRRVAVDRESDLVVVLAAVAARVEVARRSSIGISWPDGDATRPAVAVVLVCALAPVSRRDQQRGRGGARARAGSRPSNARGSVSSAPCARRPSRARSSPRRASCPARETSTSSAPSRSASIAPMSA